MDESKGLGEGLKAMTEKIADQVLQSPGFQEEEFPSVVNSVEDKSEVVEEQPKAPETTKEVVKEETPKTSSDDETSLPDELKTPKDLGSNEEALKRVKGFQSAFTKKMQSLESEIRTEYENKFREVLAKMPGQAQQSTSQPSDVPTGESLSEFFPNVPKEQLDPLDKAIKTLIEKRVQPLRAENEELKGYINQSKSTQAIQQQYQEAKTAFPEVEKRMDDLVAWSMANPQTVKGKTVKEMYMLMTYAEQYKRGKETALTELRRKEKESVEIDSIPNTVNNKKAKTLAEAAELAFQQVQAKYSKK